MDLIPLLLSLWNSVSLSGSSRALDSIRVERHRRASAAFRSGRARVVRLSAGGALDLNELCLSPHCPLCTASTELPSARLPDPCMAPRIAWCLAVRLIGTGSMQ